jgi:hypothetical protein
VHEFDGGRELDVAGPGITGEPRHGERKHRAQPLAAGRDQVIGDLGNHRYLRSGARQYGRIDAFHVGGHELAQTIDGGGRTAFKWDDDGQKTCSGRCPEREDVGA